MGKIADFNDALPCTSPEIIDHFIQKSSNKRPKIERLFSSYGGLPIIQILKHILKKSITRFKIFIR